MSPAPVSRAFTVCLFLLTLLSPLGCNADGQAGGSGSGSGISGPLTMLPDYQARAPRTCTSVAKPPSAAQAAVLVQCSMDALSYTGLGLIQDVKLQMGSSRAFVYYSDAGLAGIDLNAQVYPLRGSYTAYFCRLVRTVLDPSAGSCIKSVVPVAEGWCWKTSFGDYKCKMQGGAPKMENSPPTAF
jgi:hypothetical protein